MSTPLRTCLICHYVFSPDDWIATTGPQTALCLACFEREIGDHKRVPTRMERDVSAVLAGLSAWIADG